MDIDETANDDQGPIDSGEDFEKKARKQGNREVTDAPLNINSLMDIMTILLVIIINIILIIIMVTMTARYDVDNGVDYMFMMILLTMALMNVDDVHELRLHDRRVDH